MPKDGSGPDKPAGRNPEAEFKGRTRSNATRQSTTAPQARLYKKGEFAETKLRYMAHALSENRNGLVVDLESTQTTGRRAGRHDPDDRPQRAQAGREGRCGQGL